MSPIRGPVDELGALFTSLTTDTPCVRVRGPLPYGALPTWSREHSRRDLGISNQAEQDECSTQADDDLGTHLVHSVLTTRRRKPSRACDLSDRAPCAESHTGHGTRRPPHPRGTVVVVTRVEEVVVVTPDVVVDPRPGDGAP